MKSATIIIIVTCALLTITASCTKKEAPAEKYYYGNIQGEIKGLPGTPGMDLYADDEKLGYVGMGGGFGLGGTIKVPAEKPFTLKFKRKDTDSLLLDTLLTIGKFQTANFNIVYSEELGIKGFIQTKPVALDSISFQVLNNLNEAQYPYPDVDLYIMTMDAGTWELKDTFAILPQFKKGKLMSQVFTIPTRLDSLNNPKPDYVIYAGMLKNRQTGTFVDFGGFNYFYFLIDIYTMRGTFSIFMLENDGGGYVYMNPIIL